MPTWSGFDAIDIEATRVYGLEDARAFLTSEGMDAGALASDIDGAFISAFVCATKPGRVMDKAGHVRA